MSDDLTLGQILDRDPEFRTTGENLMAARIEALERISTFLHQCITDGDDALEYVCKEGLLVDLFATAEAGHAMPCPVCRPDESPVR